MRILRLDGRHLVLALVTAFAALPCHAAGVVTINVPWIRAAKGATVAEGYMELRSSEAATLVGVTSELATSVTIRPPGKGSATVPELALPAGKAVTLAPGRYWLAIANLAHPVELGDHVPLTLSIRDADGKQQEIAINAEVRHHSAIYDHLHGHAH